MAILVTQMQYNSVCLSVCVFRDNRDDQTPRVCVLALLSHLDPSRPLHRRLLEELATQLLQKVPAGANKHTLKLKSAATTHVYSKLYLDSLIYSLTERSIVTVANVALCSL